MLARPPGSASWLCATPAPALPGTLVAAAATALDIRTSPRLPPRLKNAVVTDAPAYGQETLLLEGEWIGDTQVLMCLWRSCRTCALALVRHLPARSWSPVAPDAVHRGTLPGDAGRSVPGRHPSEHNKCISMQSCIRRFCVCNSAEPLLLPTHLLLLREACADSSRYSAASEQGVARLKALRDRPDAPSGQYRPLWGGRGVSERADDLTSQHRDPAYLLTVLHPS